VSKACPGTPFQVEYAEGRFIEVQVLSLRKQEVLGGMMQQLQDAEASQDLVSLMRLCRETLQLIMPNYTDEVLDTIEADDALTIAGLTMAKTGLNKDESKKSELPPLSGAANSANTAAENAEKITPTVTR